MNRYPLWKYLLIIAVTVIGMLYALPNLYPSDPSLHITMEGKNKFDNKELDKIKTALTEAKIPVKKLESSEKKLTIRFNNTDDQFASVDPIKATLGKKYITALTLAPTTPDWLRSINALPMYLGLDLRGGVHFLMEVDMKTAIDKSLQRYSSELGSFLREKKLRYLGVIRQNDTLIIKFKTEALRAKALKALNREYTTLLDFKEIPSEKGVALQAKLTDININNTKRFALQQNITTLRNRVNELGVSEPIIQQQGLERIVVELPGVQDPSEAKKILGATATLEFRMVDEENDPFQAEATGRVPVGDKLFKERNGRPILLKRKVMLTGDYITGAAAVFDQDNRPAVSITLDGKGANIFARETGKNVQKLMGVVFIEHKTDVTKLPDGTISKKTKKTQEVINVARIQEQLSKRFQITGLDSPQESHNLALLLRAGALAAPIYIVEERTIGPSLGADNIEAGKISVIIGFVLVLIFMAIYYRVFGLVANIALTLNLVLIVAILSMLQATLTLPGIAGIVLTVGMAVDANVLIYERIKEELRNGLTPQLAIQSGYEKAFSTIADANITTLIAAIVLYQMGTGPIKGFAITLAIGIVSSMFTAIMGTRSIINLIYGNRRIKKLHI
ncbi:MAG: protein translocase subunit SecD [Aquificaceae bacterium]|nr:MAG: protein translocase subunit SecD [Aquificaceae bacterium]